MSTPELPLLQYFEPANIVAGDTASWYLLLGNYPPPTWTLSYALRGALDGKQPVGVPSPIPPKQRIINFSEVSPSPDGQQHLIQILPAVTVLWVPGFYKWQSYVTNNVTTDRVTINWGDIEIRPDLALSDPIDPRSYVRRMRDATAEALKFRMEGGQIEHYSILSRSFSKMPIAQLNMLWREYQGYVQQEEQAEMARKGLGNPRQTRVSFTRTAGVFGSYPYWPGGLNR
jgi:hypothetical protein